MIMNLKKLLSTLCVLSLIQLSSFAGIELDDVTSPKDTFYRLGPTNSPEKKLDFEIAPVITPVVKKETIVETAQNVTYADLSIKKMALEISKAIEIEYSDMQADLSLLWQGAASKSDTIKFAIYKLSNPDKDKPDTGAVKKVLATIAGMSTFVGAGTGNPVFASAALIGGNTLGIMSQDSKTLNYKYTRVTDADMIILVRKVEELQQKVVDMYYDYLSARQLFNMTSEMVEKTYLNYMTAQKSSREIVLVTDTFYREALDRQQQARGNFFEKRSRLEQLVGNDIFREFENGLDSREFKTK